MRLTPETIVVFSGYEPLTPNIVNSNKNEKIQKNWYLLAEERPEYPAKLIYHKDSKEHAALPLYGLYLESAGKRNAFRIKEVLADSYADEAGFSSGDYLEISALDLQTEEDIATLCMYVYVKRRKGGYIESFMQFFANLDHPNYF